MMQRPKFLDHQDLDLVGRFAVYGALVGLALVTLTLGALGGVKLARVQPSIVNLTIIGGASQPRGGSFTISEQTRMPADCIPSTRRWIKLDVPSGSPPGTKPVLDLLPGDSLPDNLPNVVPIPFGDKAGCGAYHEQKTTQGCGTFSGILTPLSTTSKPVRACVLPGVVALAKAQ